MPTTRSLDHIVPEGAWDTHAHLVGPADHYPLAIPMKEPIPRCEVSDYRSVAASLGLARVVFSQPSFYGLDNRCQLDGVAALGELARAVVAIDPAIGDEELRDLYRRGARGVRLAAPLGQGPDESFAANFAGRLNALDERLAGRDWFIEILAPSWLTTALAPALHELRTNYVLCHAGMYQAALGTEQPGFQEMIRLTGSGRCWLKLTAAYRWSSAADFADTVPMVRALGEAAAERLLWGTDHPHIQAPPRTDNRALLDLLCRWFPEDGMREKVLVDNPRELFGLR